MSLSISLQSELIKSKKTASLYLTLVAAAVIPFIFILDATVDGISPENRAGIFNKIFTEGFKMIGFLIMPVFIVLICTLLPQLEYKNNAWKQVLASPQTKANIFVAKFINIHLFILLFLIASFVFMLVAAVVMHFVHPTINLLNQQVETYKIFENILHTYVCFFALGTIQFWLGLRFKNFIAPIAIGISLWIIGTMLVVQFQSTWAVYFPYSLHAYNIFPEFKADLNAIRWTSVAYAVAFLILSFIDFNRRVVKS